LPQYSRYSVFLHFSRPHRGLRTTPEQFAAFQKAEITKWAKTIKDANIKVD